MTTSVENTYQQTGALSHQPAPKPQLRSVFAILGVILLGYTASLIVRGPNGASPTWLDGWGTAIFELVASLLMVARGLRHRRDRYALLLGLGGVAWSLGDFVNVYLGLGGGAATLDINNFLWAGFFPLAYVGMMLLIRRDVRRLDAANYLDGVIASLVVTALILAFAFHAIVRASGGGTEFAAVNLVYPLLDLLLLGLAVLGAAMLPRGARQRWYLFAVAGALNAAGDIAALFSALAGTPEGWFVNVIAWPASLFLFAAGVWLSPDSGVEPKEQAASAGFRIPAVASSFALVILFAGSLLHLEQAALGFASATLLAAGIRFGLALRAFGRLNDERRAELEAAAGAERESKRALQSAIRDYAQFAARVADGDLTATVGASDQELRELSESLNAMVAGLAEISSEIQGGVQEIGASTSEILGSVNQHTDSAGRQSAAISQTSATVNELRDAADLTAERAEEVARRAGESVRVSAEGNDAVVAIAEAMQEIRGRVEAIAGEIVELAKRAEQISAITDTVNSLSDRSNLLALNATIEAARAGEAGKGFAVVAEQVRQLAEQSKEATGRVEGILAEVKQASAAAVAASESGAEVVSRGLELTTRAGDGIRRLSETIEAAAQAAEEIASSARQQCAGMDEIATAMSSVEAGTAQFLDGAGASRVAAENLEGLAAKLAALSDRYRVNAG